LESLDEADGFEPEAGFGDDVESRRGLQRTMQSAQHERVVFRENDGSAQRLTLS
jgi:hypothetical protein